jgi:hypothetical protein
VHPDRLKFEQEKAELGRLQIVLDDYRAHPGSEAQPHADLDARILALAAQPSVPARADAKIIDELHRRRENITRGTKKKSRRSGDTAGKSSPIRWQVPVSIAAGVAALGFGVLLVRNQPTSPAVNETAVSEAQVSSDQQIVPQTSPNAIDSKHANAPELKSAVEVPINTAQKLDQSSLAKPQASGGLTAVPPPPPPPPSSTAASAPLADRKESEVERSAVDQQASEVARSAVDQQESEVARSAVDQQESEVARSAVDQQASEVARSAVDQQESQVARSAVDQQASEVFVAEPMAAGADSNQLDAAVSVSAPLEREPTPKPAPEPIMEPELVIGASEMDAAAPVGDSTPAEATMPAKTMPNTESVLGAQAASESQVAQRAVDKQESQAARSAVDRNESQVAQSAVDKHESRTREESAISSPAPAVVQAQQAEKKLESEVERLYAKELARIRKAQLAGDIGKARALLAVFIEKNPTVVLPADLRALQILED